MSNQNKKTWVLIDGVIIITITFEFIFLLSSNNFFTKMAIIYMFIVWAIIIFNIIRIYDIASLPFFSFFAIGLFNLTRYAEFLTNKSGVYSSFIYNKTIVFSESTIKTSIICITLFMFFLYETIVRVKINNKCIRIRFLDTSRYHIYFEKVSERVGLFLMISMAPAYYYRLIQELNYAKSFGRNAIYARAGVEYSNLFLSISHSMFFAGFLLLMASKPTIKKFIIGNSLNLLGNILELLKGDRSALVFSIMFIVWYLNKIYKKKFNYIFLGILVIPLLYMFMWISQVRVLKEVNLNGAIINLLSQQGSSADVFLIFIQYKNDLSYNTYPYALDNIFMIFNLLFDGGIYTGQNELAIQHRYYLAHHVTNFLSSSAYLRGSSTGDNCIAELWEFSYIGIILGAILMGYFIKKMEKCKCTSYFLFCSFLIVKYSFYCFRGPYLFMNYEWLKYSLMFVFLYVSFYFVFGFKSSRIPFREIGYRKFYS